MESLYQNPFKIFIVFMWAILATVLVDFFLNLGMLVPLLVFYAIGGLLIAFFGRQNMSKNPPLGDG